MESNLNLAELFDAKSVAVIGASSVPGKWGFGILSLLLAKGGRDVYAINKKGAEVLGVKAYQNLREVPGPIDFAVVVSSARDTPAAMEDCVCKGVKYAVVIPGGFAEASEEGARLEREVVEIARRGGIRFIGPNCMGHFDTYSDFFTIPFNFPIAKGPASMITQSGNSGIAVFALAWQAGLGFAKYINSGNEADIRFEDFLEYLGRDDRTKVILGYVEGLRDGRRFLKLAREITRRKPIVMLKAGRTDDGARAARSHSAALAGSEQASAAAFKQAGVIRVEEVSDLVDAALALSTQPLPRGRRVGLLSMGGGLGVITTDALRRCGLEMARFSSRTMEKLNSALSDRWSHGNPVDPGGEPVVYPCIFAMMEDENVDAVMIVGGVGMVGGLVPLMPTPPAAKAAYERLMEAAERQELENLDRLAELRDKYQKPVITASMLRGSIMKGAVSEKLEQYHLMPYTGPERAAKALARLVEYSEYLGVARTPGP